MELITIRVASSLPLSARRGVNKLLQETREKSRFWDAVKTLGSATKRGEQKGEKEDGLYLEKNQTNFPLIFTEHKILYCESLKRFVYRWNE